MAGDEGAVTAFLELACLTYVVNDGRSPLLSSPMPGLGRVGVRRRAAALLRPLTPPA
jgi:hypothetical protein